MPDPKTTRRAARQKTPSGKAGEYVREEMEHIREGKHGARSSKQAIAIGLSKARRAGVKLPPPPGGKKTTKASNQPPNPRRSKAISGALKREGGAAASHLALTRHSKESARERGPAARQASARKAARTRAKNRE